MKRRIIFAIAAVVALCLLAKFAPAVFEHGGRSGTGGPKSGMTNASSPSKFHYRRDELMGDMQTAMAVLRYWLEPEPPELNKELVASNDAEKTLLGPNVSSHQMPKSVQSNLLAPFGGLAPTELVKGDPCTNQSLVASIVTLTPGMICSPFLFNDTLGMHFFPGSPPASLLEEGRGCVVERRLCFNDLWFSNTVELLNTVVTNSEHAPLTPAKNYKPGLTDSAERPA